MHPRPPTGSASRDLGSGVRSTILGIFINILLAITKGTAGVIGNSYALIADAIESLSDIFSSIVVLFGLKMAGKPPDDAHPYGHGKFEPLAAAIVGLMLIGAAILIGVESVHEILTPHHAPAWFTLIVLAITIMVKECLSRHVSKIGTELESTVVKSDAAHHRSDVVTSAAAFIGISIALIGGPGYESADDFAALIAAGVIAVNAFSLLRPAIFELVDTAPDPALVARVREVAQGVKGVLGTHKCQVRKIGFDYFVDLDILCDPEASIRTGHEIAHDVGEAIHLTLPQITKVLVHVEPVDDYGRRSRDIS